MGNRLCKKKSDVVDNAHFDNNNDRSPSKFDRIINRLHLTPNAWKSESHLNKKENRCKSVEPSKKGGESIFYTTQPLSKSTDWTNADLEVPAKDEDEGVHLKNPKLSLIFDNDSQSTPTPPPRKNHPKGEGTNLKEKIGKIARNDLQAIQGDNKQLIEEPLMVKKKINYNCPLCDSDEKNHNRDHQHNHQKNSNHKKDKLGKRKKNLSVVSLPNYTDLKLSLAKQSSKTNINSSSLNLQTTTPKKLTSSQSTGTLGAYMTRCRSFGSLFPQQFKKLKPQKLSKAEDVTSDDSFGPLEDWDLGLIEHYNPKDASLPRPSKNLTDRTNDVLYGIESLIVKNEDIEVKPKPPARRSESLVKKMNKGVQQGAKNTEEACLTLPPSPEPVTNEPKVVKALSKLRNQEEPVEHSSLMRILQEFSIKDKQQQDGNSNVSSLTPSLVEFEKNLSSNAVQDFINAEKNHTGAVFG